MAALIAASPESAGPPSGGAFLSSSPIEIDEKWLAIGMKTYKGIAGKYALRCKALQNFLYALFPRSTNQLV